MSMETIYNQISNEEWYQELQANLLTVRKCIIESENKDERYQLMEKYDLIVLEINDKTTEKLLHCLVS